MLHESHRASPSLSNARLGRGARFRRHRLLPRRRREARGSDSAGTRPRHAPPGRSSSLDDPAILDPARPYDPFLRIDPEILRCCLLRTLLSYSGHPTEEGGTELRPSCCGDAPGLPRPAHLDLSAQEGDPLCAAARNDHDRGSRRRPCCRANRDRGGLGWLLLQLLLGDPGLRRIRTRPDRHDRAWRSSTTTPSRCT